MLQDQKHLRAFATRLTLWDYGLTWIFGVTGSVRVLDTKVMLMAVPIINQEICKFLSKLSGLPCVRVCVHAREG